MLSVVQTELLKIKRQKMILGICGILVLFWAGLTFWTYHIPRTDSQMDNFSDFYTRYGSYLSILLAFIIGLLFIKSYSGEYRNDTLKELLQVPISMNTVFASKVLFVLILAIVIMALNCLLVLLGAFICSFPDITLSNSIDLVREFFLIGLLFPFALFPVFLAAVISKGNTVFSSTFNFAYILSGLAGLEPFAGIHPISSLFSLLFNKQIAFGVDFKEQLIYAGNIFLGAIFIGIIVVFYYSLNRKK